MLSQSVRLLLALSALWGVLVVPAYLIGGLAAVAGLSAAVLLCLLPGIVVVALQTGPLSEQQPLAGLLIGMGLRLAFVLAAVLFVRQVWPDLPATTFLIWVVPAYLVALALETRFVTKRSSNHVGVPVEPTHLRATGSS